MSGVDAPKNNIDEEYIKLLMKDVKPIIDKIREAIDEARRFFDENDYEMNIKPKVDELIEYIVAAYLERITDRVLDILDQVMSNEKQ